MATGLESPRRHKGHVDCFSRPCFPDETLSPVAQTSLFFRIDFVWRFGEFHLAQINNAVVAVDY